MYHFDFVVIQNYLVKSMAACGGRLLVPFFGEVGMRKILVGAIGISLMCVACTVNPTMILTYQIDRFSIEDAAAKAVQRINRKPLAGMRTVEVQLNADLVTDCIYKQAVVFASKDNRVKYMSFVVDESAPEGPCKTLLGAQVYSQGGAPVKGKQSYWMNDRNGDGLVVARRLSKDKVFVMAGTRDAVDAVLRELKATDDAIKGKR